MGVAVTWPSKMHGQRNIFKKKFKNKHGVDRTLKNMKKIIEYGQKIYHSQDIDLWKFSVPGDKINRMSDIFKTYYLHELLKSNLKYNIAPIIEK